MYENREKLRQSIIVTILAAYFAPVLLFTIFSLNFMELSQRWLFFSSSLLAAVIGTILLIVSMLFWESQQDIRSEPIPAAPVPEKKETSEPSPDILKAAMIREKELKTKLDHAKQKWHSKKTEFDTLQAQFKKVQHDFESLQIYSEEQLKKKDRLLAEYAQTVNELRGAMERKQDQIEKLQDSVSDLSYDLDTLLKLSNFDSVKEAGEGNKSHEEASPVKELPRTPSTFCAQDASSLLKKCINVAQKLTSNQFTTSSRFRELPINSTALDQRRLFESFRSETSCLIVMYSMKEGALTFANDMTKHMLGWTPDKFVQEFSHLFQEGQEEWRTALQSLSHQSEAICRFTLKTRLEEPLSFACHMGMIPTGVFKNYVVGVLYEDKERS